MKQNARLKIFTDETARPVFDQDLVGDLSVRAKADGLHWHERVGSWPT
jgi:hypothetical protein